MNLATLDRYLTFRIDAIRQSGTVINTYWDEDERVEALNNGYREVCKLIRRQRKDHFTRRRRSTDAVVFIRDQNYDPASFRFISGTATYTLPPDYLELRSVVAVTSGREHVLFDIEDENSQRAILWRRRPPPTGQQVSHYVLVVVGERTLFVVPTPQETLDLELAYVAQPERLIAYSTGSITLTAGSTAVVVSAAADFRERVSGVRAGDDLMVGAVSPLTSTATPSLLELDRRWPRILSVGADGLSLTLAEPYQGATAGHTGYLIASVPQFHEDWQHAIAYYAAWELLSKGKQMGKESAAQVAWGDWERVAATLIPESAQRSTQDLPVAEDGWVAAGIDWP